MNLVIDIDGVLADFNASFIRDLIELFGPPPNKPAVGTYIVDHSWINEWDYPQEILGYSDAQVNALWANIARNPMWWGRLDPYATTFRDLQELRRLEVDGEAQVYFVTSRPSDGTRLVTARWLERMRYPGASVILADLKIGKRDLAYALRADAVIDDKPQNLVEMDAKGRQLFVMDRPWNQSTVPWLPYHRVSSIREMLQILGLMEMAVAA